ncbi:indole-3-acetic acid-amido synthetase GH3.15 isoform X2 [Gossypium hirsutum]|uniref:Indole-3-acetic acid-amido synthetase GH3.15 isoform X2 n=1 Tax=Gossypium hirsutum TaxID=3635 RepID=A0ABM3BLG1_GOSHI|nr:indole-3-acetic acid-amido synthetase GH3.15 isoform X2 [Gossypium hirsutum]
MTNAKQIQEEVLGQILKRNAATEYLSRYLHVKTDKKLFKMNVPIVTYEDIKPYIDRIANGEPSNILLAESVLEFFRSGTSGGQPKLIPVNAETLKLLAVSSALLTAVMKKHFGNLDQAVKSLEFQFAKEETETPCGLKSKSCHNKHVQEQ